MISIVHQMIDKVDTMQMTKDLDKERRLIHFCGDTPHI